MRAVIGLNSQTRDLVEMPDAGQDSDHRHEHGKTQRDKDPRRPIVIHEFIDIHSDCLKAVSLFDTHKTPQPLQENENPHGGRKAHT